MKGLLSLGDCNTLGILENEGNAYPERASKQLGIECTNRGLTMASSYELVDLFNDTFTPDIGLVTIQCGLVDSWKTFKYAPYVKYYPDNFLRKFARKIVKKYKKVARKAGLHTFLGDKYVVNEETYLFNLKLMIEATDIPFLLIETTPTNDQVRNREIKRYNNLIKMLSNEYPHTYFIECFDLLNADIKKYVMDDGVHLTSLGHEALANKIVTLVDNERLRVEK